MDRELRVLGRIAVCHDWGWTLEADPCLLEAAVEKLGMTDSKGISTPGHKDEPAEGHVTFGRAEWIPDHCMILIPPGLDLMLARNLIIRS